MGRLPRGPLADTYPAAVALVVLSLTPFLALTTAIQPLQDLITQDTGLSMRSLQLGTGMANAAYSFGSVLAVQLAAWFTQRRLLIVYVALFVLGSALAAWSPTGAVFLVGHVTQGLATGLLLVGSVPPLILGFGNDTVPTTATTFNLGLFGAVALGPVIGGASAATGTWHPLFWIVTGLGALGLVLAFLTYEDDPGPTGAPSDLGAVALAGGGSAALFFAVSELMGRRATDLVVLGPALVGVALLVGFFVHEGRREEPLIPVRKLLGVLPTAGTIAVVTGSAASVGLVTLSQEALDQRGLGPLHAGFLFWPQFATAAVAAFVFAKLFVSRWMPVLTFAGLVCLLAAAFVLTGVASGGDALVLVGSALLGLGVGGAVSPGFYTAAFTVSAEELPRVFSVVEQLRGAAAFTIGPALVQLATTTGSSPQHGIRTGVWVVVGVAATGTAAYGAVLVRGLGRLDVPSIDPWLDEDEPAMGTPPLRDAFTPRPRHPGLARGLAGGLAGLGAATALVVALRPGAGEDAPAAGQVAAPLRVRVVGPRDLRAFQAGALSPRGVRVTRAGRFLPARRALRRGRLDGVLVVRADGTRRLYLSRRNPARGRALATRLTGGGLGPLQVTAGPAG